MHHIIYSLILFSFARVWAWFGCFILIPKFLFFVIPTRHLIDILHYGPRTIKRDETTQVNGTVS